jgi:Kef-type K+ transport system membrane component KefB
MKKMINKPLPRLVLVVLAVIFLSNAGFKALSAQSEADTAHTDSGMVISGDSTPEQGVTPDTHAVQHGTEAEPEHNEAEEGAKGLINVLFGLIIIIFVAKVGGELAERLNQPAVLGELVFGMILGNLVLFNITAFEFIKHDGMIEILAEIGVIILLFEVGLETNLKEMLSVGTTSFLVATAGVIAPFFLGWGTAAIFLSNEHIFVHIFIGATLCATSVGITARVIKDIKKLQTKEAKIILGAAVMDDIMGLIVLSIVTGLIGAANAGTSINSVGVLIIVLKALGFVILAILIGSKLMPKILAAATNLKAQGMLLAVALIVCFSLAAMAQLIGLAAIVGAFAAGIIMEKVHWRGFEKKGEHSLEVLIYPISTFLVPIFFVHMGVMVDLSTFGDPKVLIFAGALTVAAIIGKQVCALGVLEKGTNRVAIGLGMIPRGEVGLIFVKIGHGLSIAGVAVISDSTYSAVVIMVILTTLITPPVLKTSLLKKSTDFYAGE